MIFIKFWADRWVSFLLRQLVNYTGRFFFTFDINPIAHSWDKLNSANVYYPFSIPLISRGLDPTAPPLVAPRAGSLRPSLLHP